MPCQLSLRELGLRTRLISHLLTLLIAPSPSCGPIAMKNRRPCFGRKNQLKSRSKKSASNNVRRKLAFILCNSDLSMNDKRVFMNVQIANIRGLLIIRKNNGVHYLCGQETDHNGIQPGRSVRQ